MTAPTPKTVITTRRDPVARARLDEIVRKYQAQAEAAKPQAQGEQKAGAA